MISGLQNCNELDSHHNPKVKETSEAGMFVGKQKASSFVCFVVCLLIAKGFIGVWKIKSKSDRQFHPTEQSLIPV
jgi:hypothetical protein